ncbi:MAG: hypothetical protein LCH54_10545 [Bacteroidetes bacterium]|nr:hypothetical protein [Bacteroidota bacterium]
MILRFLLLSLCILAPLRTVQAGNYYKSFAHSVLESLPDSVKRCLNPVFSQVVQVCAQLEADRYETPDLTDRHFDFGTYPGSDSVKSTGSLASFLLLSFDSLRYYLPTENQKKLIWYTASLIHFSSELALPHRIHPGFLDPDVYSDVTLHEDEKLTSRNSKFNFPVLDSLPGDLNLTPDKVIKAALLKNRQLSSEILIGFESSELKKNSNSSDRRHKNGKNVMLSLYGNHQEQFLQLVAEAQQVAVSLLISAVNCNQNMENSHKK